MLTLRLKRALIPALVLVLSICAPIYAQDALKPVSWTEVAAWRSVNQSSVTMSDNGLWFAWWDSPNRGDSDLLLRHTRDTIQKKWPIGEAVGNPRASIAFNADATFLGFLDFPTEEAKKKAPRDNPPQSKLRLIDLRDFSEKEFENVRSFSFSGENPLWIAINLSTPRPDRSKEAGKGTDLLLYNLNTGATFNLGNVTSFSFNKSGNWFAYIVDAYGKAGNGVFLRNMQTGETLAPESDKASYQSLNWNREGTALIALKGVEDKAWKDELFSIVGFRDFDRTPRKVVYNPANDSTFPEGMTISSNRMPMWSDDLQSFVFGIRSLEKKEEPARNQKADEKTDSTATAARAAVKNTDEKPDLVLWHWNDSRLQSVQQNRESQDKNFSYTAIFHIGKDLFVRLADEEVRSAVTYPRGDFAIGFDSSPYELIGAMSGQSFRDIYRIDLNTGEKKLILKELPGSAGVPVSPDGKLLLYYLEGHYHVYNLHTDESVNITQNIPTSFVNKTNDVNVSFPPTPSWGWTSDSRHILIRDNHDVWLVQANGRGAENLSRNGAENNWIYQFRFRLDEEERSIDIRQPLYMRVFDDNTKQTGIAVIERGRPGARVLIMEEAIISFLSKAKNAEVYTFGKETPDMPPSWYVSFSPLLQNPKKLTETYPEQAGFAWSPGVRLISFVSEKGDSLQAALYLPAGYEEGKSYPTVVYIYERLTQNLFSYSRPNFPGGGFNRSMYTSNGYAVLMPDIVYRLNDPGMSAVWCVLPAVEAAIVSGIVDRENIAIHGHSWGGYQTSFLITQTDIFKAAVAGAPLTNMISMYSLIYWNTGGTNQAIFESSQGRFTSGYWDNWEAYKRNSPVYFAKQVNTPLLLMHNDKDGAVDFTQGIEYYNTLRRLQKPVVLLQYKGENHGLRKTPNQIDYALRMMEFLDHYLKGKEAPYWLTDGIPLLEMEKHLEGRPIILGK